MWQILQVFHSLYKADTFGIHLGWDIGFCSINIVFIDYPGKHRCVDGVLWYYNCAPGTLWDIGTTFLKKNTNHFGNTFDEFDIRCHSDSTQ